MAFDSVSLIATGLGLNETRMGESNPVSNHNLLKKQGLVSAATPECSTIDEIPGRTIVKSLLDKMIYCGALLSLTVAVASRHNRISDESSHVLG